jgi:hypothetical protein
MHLAWLGLSLVAVSLLRRFPVALQPDFGRIVADQLDLLNSRLDAIEEHLHAQSQALLGAETRLKRLQGMALGDAKRDKLMAKSTEELRTAVEEQKDATRAAVTLIEGLADQIEGAGGDEAEITRITAEIRGTAQELAKAVTDNTQFEPSGNR